MHLALEVSARHRAAGSGRAREGVRGIVHFLPGAQRRTPRLTALITACDVRVWHTQNTFTGLSLQVLCGELAVACYPCRVYLPTQSQMMVGPRDVQVLEGRAARQRAAKQSSRESDHKTEVGTE